MTNAGCKVLAVIAIIAVSGHARADFLTIKAVDSVTRANVPALSIGGNVMVTSTGPFGLRQQGYMKFDLSAIPDDATITGLSLTTYTWNPTGLVPTFGNPRLQVFRSSSDAWTRSGPFPPFPGTDQALTSVITGFPSADKTAYNWTLDPMGGNWATDLTDDTLTLVIRNQRNTLSYAAWYGSGGGILDPNGDFAPTLRIEYTPAIPEPTTMALAGIGLAGLGLARLRRRRSAV